MTDFNKLKTQSKQSLDKLTEELKKMNSGGGGEHPADDRFWYPDVDKAGNGYAVVRFLPAPPNEDLPFVRLWRHAFQGPGGWYMENSLTTLGKDDPVTEFNSELWKTGDEEKKKQASAQKRKLEYYTNVYVISDKLHPENEGKVFLFKFGKKIYDKLNNAMNPEFEDEPRINPFDLWNGADFKIKIRNVEGYRNYDSSVFDTPRPLSEDDNELEKIWRSQYSLQEIIDPKNFKSYDELKARFEKVMKLGSSKTLEEKVNEESKKDDLVDEAKEVSKPNKEKTVIDLDTDDDDFFSKLLDD